MFWFLMRHVLLGPLLRAAYRPKVVGLENVPAEGPAILAANHQSYLDSLLLPLVVKQRRVVFLARVELLRKWYLGWFLRAAGVIPVETGGGAASQDTIERGIEAVRAGQLLGIFPEGTRSPDGRLYRGKTGVARIALGAGAPVVPVALRGTFEAMPPGAIIPRPTRTEVLFGTPLLFHRSDAPPDGALLRSVTDEIMRAIVALSGQEYVDEYASRAKQRIVSPAGAGEGETGTQTERRSPAVRRT